jgi:hypothetical protein
MIMPTPYPQVNRNMEILLTVTFICGYNVPMSSKRLFKLWIEGDQLTRLEAVAEKEKTSIAWAIRRAVDIAYPARPTKKKKK